MSCVSWTEVAPRFTSPVCVHAVSSSTCYGKPSQVQAWIPVLRLASVVDCESCRSQQSSRSNDGETALSRTKRIVPDLDPPIACEIANDDTQVKLGGVDIGHIACGGPLLKSVCSTYQDTRRAGETATLQTQGLHRVRPRYNARADSAQAQSSTGDDDLERKLIAGNSTVQYLHPPGLGNGRRDDVHPQGGTAHKGHLAGCERLAPSVNGCSDTDNG